MQYSVNNREFSPKIINIEYRSSESELMMLIKIPETAHWNALQKSETQTTAISDSRFKSNCVIHFVPFQFIQ